MTFLQLGFLLALPLALLPVIIHLLNRLRYRTVKWAGMMFLLAASRSSTRRSKLRHYLILASRCLLLAGFLLALARPQVGGWLGSRLSGKPDVILLLLDRSASMERLDPRHQLTRRAHALNLFAAGAEQLGPGPRFVLIDSATLQSQEVANPSALGGMSLAGPTDTAADAAGLIQSAVDYLVRNPAGKAELWLASDMQVSNWSPDSPRWARLSAALAALPGDNRLRLLDLSGAPGENLSLALRDLRRVTSGKEDALVATIEIQRPTGEPRTLPLAVELAGARTQAEIALDGTVTRIQQRLPLPIGAATGWGRLELPADANARDNAAWLVFGPAHLTPAVVSVGESDSARLFSLAVAPDGKLRSARTLPESALGTEKLDGTAFVVWQPGSGEPTIAGKLEAFAQAGGTVLIVPPTGPSAPSLAGLSWKPVEDAPPSQPFGVTFWEQEDGPLAKTGGGVNLPVDEVTAQRRRVPVPAGDDAAGPRWTVLATFGDQQPMLLRRLTGRGALYALSTLPQEGWSNLRSGRVLVPMVQRLLADGGRRLASGRQDVCGEWKPADAATAADWSAADGDTNRDWSRQAGAYRLGDRLVALNRPAAEDEAGQIEPARAAALFGDDFRNVTVAADLGEKTTGRDRGEIWRTVLGLALLFLLLESFLVSGLTVARPPAVAAAKPAPARREAA